MLALTVVGCGSSSSGGASTQASRTGTRSASTPSLRSEVAEELARFPQLPVAATAHLPQAPRSERVERAYLTALFDDAQSVWRHEFADAHVQYRAARLIIFFSQSHSSCGAGKNSGPYYCPTDRGVYLDLRFFGLLLRESHVAEAAQAFIVGHEVAHHVQRLAGIAASVSAANKADPSRARARGMAVELEADCLAGVWARSAYPRSGMSSTDLYDGLRTAHLIGDDYGAEAAGSVADPALFTHGSSDDRKYWLRTGYRSGRPEACNTFTSP